MKIIRILMNHSRNLSEADVREFLDKNMPREILHGLAYDDPKTISRVLKMLNISDPKAKESARALEEHHHQEQPKAASGS